VLDRQLNKAEQLFRRERKKQKKPEKSRKKQGQVLNLEFSKALMILLTVE